METHGILKKAAEKTGLTRVRYKERNMPTSVEGVTIFPFFGDNRSSFVLSSLLLRRIKEEAKSSKYFILVSWPGHEGLYPYVDEYWQVDDESMLEKLKSGVEGFSNLSSVFTFMVRDLNQYFYEVMTSKDLVPFYDNGLTKEFFERFKHVKVSLPSIPPAASIGVEFARTLGQKESKVFVYPSKETFSWKMGQAHAERAPKEFWISLLEFLHSGGFFPVVYTDAFSYDLSSDFNKDCLHIKSLDLLKSFSIMRSCGCVLDIFSGVSRYALAARVPFVCLDERAKFNGLKDYEINDLCGRGISKEYIFGFGTLIQGGDRAVWRSNMFDHLSVKLKKIYETMDRDSWPSSAEYNEIVPYDTVRKKKNKKLGARFIKIQKD